VRILHVGHGYTPFHHGGLLAYAEDLMGAQVAAGHEVAYFCKGRNYPLMPPRVVRRTRDGVRLYELLNSPAQIGPLERGTRHPRRDLEDAGVERLFREVLGEVRPDVVHVQELGGLPSSVLDAAHDGGAPVVMTLHDYFPLCPTVKLFDVDGRNCRRREPAPQCVRCCHDAPGRLDPIIGTLGYHRRAVERRLPVVERLPKPRAILRRRRTTAGADEARPALGTPDAEEVGGDVEGYAVRRAVNVARLSRVDRLLAVSSRVAEIYAELGVDPGRLRVLGLTLTRLESLRPRRQEAVERPVRFVTLAGCSSPAKGSEVVAGALDELAGMGLTSEDLTVTIAGQVDPAIADRVAASPLVRIIGAYSTEDLDGMLEKFHVGIVPSIWEETHGFTGVELLAKGVPVIGNAVGGIVEYTRDGETGWLNRDSSFRGVAAIMAAIVREPEQVARLSERIVELRNELVPPMAAHVAALDELYGQTSSTSASWG
jgi:glycosyltransferase involved in cell wall biosynthesis